MQSGFINLSGTLLFFTLAKDFKILELAHKNEKAGVR